MSITDKELEVLAKLANKILWLEPDVREKLQEHKVNVVPNNFYSQIPSIKEINDSFEYRERNGAPYIKLFKEDYLKTFAKGLLRYSEEFSPPIEGDLDDPKGYFWNNPAFSHLDAMAYYCMIRHFKPRRILEIGAGYSTLVADCAIKKNGFGEICSIEPHPKPFLEKISSVTRLIGKKIQNLPLEEAVELVENADIWFIDSTHTVKVGSDCLYIYLKIMPEIQSKVVVHSHDVYLPQGINQKNALEKHIYWTEQYLLYAYLLDNPKASIIFGSHYTCEYSRNIADQMLHGRGQSKGGSLWYTLNHSTK